MKTQRLISIDQELHLKLVKEGNASGLINELLAKHYAKDERTSTEILSDVKERLAEQDQEEAEAVGRAQRDHFFDNLTDEQNREYKEGLREGKWRSLTEVAKIQLKEVEDDDN